MISIEQFSEPETGKTYLHCSTNTRKINTILEQGNIPHYQYFIYTECFLDYFMDYCLKALPRNEWKINYPLSQTISHTWNIPATSANGMRRSGEEKIFAELRVYMASPHHCHLTTRMQELHAIIGEIFFSFVNSHNPSKENLDRLFKININHDLLNGKLAKKEEPSHHRGKI